ncbi:MAG: glutathione S-transferase [Pseudomonadota bacterium]|nr:glutathione S-transferase [Pseudomonadota bacterium]
MTRPVLYSFRRCPFAMRARMALDVAGIEVEHREILLKDKPRAMLEASPKGTVPVLVLAEDQVLEESLDVMHWALTRNDPQAWLPVTARERDWIDRIDGPFKAALDRYKYPNRYEDSDPLVARTHCAEILAALDARLAEQRFIHGEHAGLADNATFPFIRQFAHTDRTWFDAQDWPALQAWLQHFLESERFERIMIKHPLWQDDV